MIVGTGNYAWINWIGALPCIALLDDCVLAALFRSQTVQQGVSRLPTGVFMQDAYILSRSVHGTDANE